MFCIFTFKFCVSFRRHNLSDRSLRVLQIPSYLSKLAINKLQRTESVFKLTGVDVTRND